MKRTIVMTQATKTWATPTLTYSGSVGQILKGGGGKLSVASADPGEYKCEKPHCPAAGGR
jgi:hypothetical protein